MNKHELQDLGGGTGSGLLASRASYAPDNLALIFEGQEFTYGEFDRQASAVAAGLMALGLQQGDAASVMMTNRPEHLFTSMGAGRAGLVQVPVNIAFKGEFLRYVIEHSESSAIIIESILVPALATLGKLPASVKLIVYVGDVAPEVDDAQVRVVSWADMLAGGDPAVKFPTLSPSDTGSISFTSGTTGKSKGVVSPCLQSVMMARETATAFGLTSRDRLYTCMPLFHGMAQVTTCLTAIYAGATIILAARFSVTRIWEEVRQYKATQFNALGSMLHMLLSTPASPLDREHDVQFVFAAPAPAEVLYRFESRFGVHVLEGYGQTEIKNVIYNPRIGRKVGSLGKPTPSSIMEIHDDHGNRLPAGQVGEIVYRPRVPDIMLKRYHKDAEATLSSLQGLWWHTGDLGSMDEDGFFYFYDRKSDSVRRRGENISSQEVEGALVAFSRVIDAAAVAVRSDVGEDEVLVVFEAHGDDGFDFEALFAHCVQTLPRFMVPRYYRRMPTMPRTPTGKVRKVELREAGLTQDTWDHVAQGLEVPR